MNVLLITNYPSKFEPHNSAFVYNLVQKLSGKTDIIVVISPKRPWDNISNRIDLPGEKEYGEEKAIVIRPRFLHLPNRIRFGSYSLGRLNTFTYKYSVRKVLSKLNFKPDLVYAHFLFPGGPTALDIARSFNIPSIVALGESTLAKHEKIYGKNMPRSMLSQFTGILSVSETNKEYASDEYDIDKQKIRVFPNGIDLGRFYPRDKEEMRKKYVFPLDKKIVAFVGHFIKRKGPLKVLTAIEGLENVSGIFVGDGDQKPTGNSVIFQGKVPNYKVPELLSAADLFVLPTLNEGSCNAIVEALACGLPIVSSDIASIREQVNSDCALLVNPKSTDEIRKAVSTILNNDIRQTMSTASRELSKKYSLERRAENIYNWFVEIVNKPNRKS